MKKAPRTIPLDDCHSCHQQQICGIMPDTDLIPCNALSFEERPPTTY